MQINMCTVSADFVDYRMERKHVSTCLNSLVRYWLILKKGGFYHVKQFFFGSWWTTHFLTFNYTSQLWLNIVKSVVNVPNHKNHQLMVQILFFSLLKYFPLFCPYLHRGSEDLGPIH